MKIDTHSVISSKEFSAWCKKTEEYLEAEEEISSLDEGRMRQGLFKVRPVVVLVACGDVTIMMVSMIVVMLLVLAARLMEFAW